MQLSTPSYRLKKEKRDLKKSSDPPPPPPPPKQDPSSSSLIDPSSVTVVGAVDGQEILQSPGSGSGKKKKTNPAEKGKSSSSKDKAASAEKPSKSLSSKTHRSSPDTKIEELDQKWSERFNRLEALLLAKSLDRQEPTFSSSIKVAPAHSPPAESAISSKPFIRPQASDSSVTDLASQRQATDQSHDSDSPQHVSDLPASFQTASKSTGKSTKGKVSTDRRSELSGTDPPSQQVPSRSSSAPARKQSTSSMDTDSESDISDRPPVDLFVEEGEVSDQEHEISVTDPDLALSEEQNYRETMSGQIVYGVDPHPRGRFNCFKV